MALYDLFFTIKLTLLNNMIVWHPFEYFYKHTTHTQNENCKKCLHAVSKKR